MRSITVNKLQSKISKVIKDVTAGESYQVSRYSTPVAVVLPLKKFEEMVEKSNCKSCVDDLRKLAKNIKK